MANAVQVPAHIQARIQARQGKGSAMLDSVVSGDQYPRVSIKGSRFKLIDETGETNAGDTLDVVFVGVNPRTSKVWYDKAYNPAQENVRPACFSSDGVAPDASVESPVHENCAQCPKNVLGSRKTLSGADSKECNDVRYIAVVPSVDPSKPYGLTIPVSSMKSFRLYFKDLKGYGLLPEEVITTLSFDQTVSFPKLLFSHRGYVPEKHITSVEKIINSVEVKQITRQIGGARLQPPPAQARLRPSVDADNTDDDAGEAGESGDVEDAAVSSHPVEQAAPRGRGRPPKVKDKPTDTKPSKDADPTSALEKELDSIFG